MTAETSNARGELRMADIREDAREPLQLLREKLAHDEDGWAALCQLMPMLAVAPPPAAARGDVRGLVDVVSDLRHSAVVDDYEIDQIAFLNSIADRIEAALAAEGVQAEARVYQCPRCATSMEVDPTAKPEARGVVDDLIHAASNAATIIRNCVNAREIGEGYAQHADDIDAAIAALTEARNVR